MPLVNSSELARLRGVSPVAVHKAIKAGRITPASVDERGRKLFDPDQVAQQWTANSTPGKARQGKKGGRPRDDGKPADLSPPGEHMDVPVAPSGQVDDSEEPINYNREAAREKRYKANLAKLEYEEKVGTLVRIDAVAEIVEREYTRVRTRLLSIPSKLAPELALIDDESLCRSQVEAAIVEALTELTADATVNEKMQGLAAG